MQVFFRLHSRTVPVFFALLVLQNLHGPLTLYSALNVSWHTAFHHDSGFSPLCIQNIVLASNPEGERSPCTCVFTLLEPHCPATKWCSWFPSAESSPNTNRCSSAGVIVVSSASLLFGNYAPLPLLSLRTCTKNNPEEKIIRCRRILTGLLWLLTEESVFHQATDYKASGYFWLCARWEAQWGCRYQSKVSGRSAKSKPKKRKQASELSVLVWRLFFFCCVSVAIS